MVKKILFYILIFVSTRCFPQYVTFTSNSRIFPGAVGYGTTSNGAYEAYDVSGLSGDLPTILTVDTLYAGSLSTGTYSGSFEWCVTRSYPRVVIFEVSGVIDYRTVSQNGIYITNPYCNIYGQTAPDKGITIIGTYLAIGASHILMQHIRVKPGDEYLGATANNVDALTIGSSSNVVIDHCSFAWSQDEILNTTPSNTYLTVSNCFMFNPLHYSRHYDEGGGYPEEHGYGVLIESDYFTYYRNIIYRSHLRNPAVGGSSSYGVVLNNYSYTNNYGSGTGIDGSDYHDVVGNITKQLWYQDYSDDKVGYFASATATSTYVYNNYCLYRANNPGAAETALFRNPERATFTGTSNTDLSDYYIQSVSGYTSLAYDSIGAFFWHRDYHDSINIVNMFNEVSTSISSPEPMGARAYNDGVGGDYGTNGNMVSGYDWSAGNQTLIINSNTYTLTADCNSVNEVVTHINSVLPVGFECVKHPETNYVILQTTATGSGVSFTLSGTACSTLGMNQETYTGTDGDGGWPNYTKVSRTLTLPTNPHYDDDTDGQSNLQEWVQTFETYSSESEPTNPSNKYIRQNSKNMYYRIANSNRVKGGSAIIGLSLLNGLVAYWKLDESSGDAIDSYGSNDGTVSGATYDSTGVINTCYYFDGSDVVNIPANSDFNFDPDNDAYSFGGWVKINSGGQGYIISKATSATETRQWGLYVVSSSLGVVIGGTSRDLGVNIDDGDWHHIMVCLKGDGTGVAYIDGSVDDTSLGVGSATNTTYVRIGAREGGFNWTGLIDEIGVWSRELTSSEVLELYNSGVGKTYPF